MGLCPSFMPACLILRSWFLGGGAAVPADACPPPEPVCKPVPECAHASACAQLLGEYRSWVDEQLKASDVASVAVFYASAYGNTSALAQVRCAWVWV